MTPPLSEFLTGLAREKQRRELEQKKAYLDLLNFTDTPERQYRSYRYQIFHDTTAKRKSSYGPKRRNKYEAF